MFTLIVFLLVCGVAYYDCAYKRNTIMVNLFFGWTLIVCVLATVIWAVLG